MKEKGQALIVIVGILMLIGMFVAGWLVGNKFSPPVDGDSFDLKKINVVEDKDLKDGTIHTSKIVVDNCRSSVPSITEETRDFTYQQIFSFDTNSEFGAGFKDAIYVKLEKIFGIESGGVGKVSRTFHFTSPPELKSIHVIAWTEKLRSGYVEYNGEKYPYSFPDNIDTSQSSTQESCP